MFLCVCETITRPYSLVNYALNKTSNNVNTEGLDVFRLLFEGWNFTNVPKNFIEIHTKYWIDNTCVLSLLKMSKKRSVSLQNLHIYLMLVCIRYKILLQIIWPILRTIRRNIRKYVKAANIYTSYQNLTFQLSFSDPIFKAFIGIIC